MATERMLTTTDNPYDPFTEFNAWYQWDTSTGYHTVAYLARVTVSSDELSEADQAAALYQAMKEIVEVNGEEVYKILTRETAEA